MAAAGGGEQEALDTGEAPASTLSPPVSSPSSSPPLVLPPAPATATHGDKQEQQKQPVPAPDEATTDECAICLGDLQFSAAAAAGTNNGGDDDGDGTVLLACSHALHAGCLERWKAKCLEKGLRFTCPLCRGPVVVVPAAAGATAAAGTEKKG